MFRSLNQFSWVMQAVMLLVMLNVITYMGLHVLLAVGALLRR